MGAVTFSLDPKLVDAIRSCIPLKVLVETGTFKGDTVATYLYDFEEVVSVELSSELWIKATKRFESDSNVRILQGDSATRLSQLRSVYKNTSALYWLDAHWCESDITAGKLSQCPLVNELKAIGKLNSESVILIDDARLFLAPPPAPHEISQWPSFHEIVVVMLSMSSEHELMVVNDVIAFFPKNVKVAMQLYAKTFGIDWLNATNCLLENGNFMKSLIDKENVIKETSLALNAFREALEAVTIKLANVDEPYRFALEAKEKVIQEQCKTINRYKYYLFPLLFMGKLKRRISNIIRPRLGNLNQYSPRLLNTKNFDCIKNMRVFFQYRLRLHRSGKGHSSKELY